MSINFICRYPLAENAHRMPQIYGVVISVERTEKKRSKEMEGKDSLKMHTIMPANGFGVYVEEKMRTKERGKSNAMMYNNARNERCER